MQQRRHIELSSNFETKYLEVAVKSNLVRLFQFGIRVPEFGFAYLQNTINQTPCSMPTIGTLNVISLV